MRVEANGTGFELGTTEATPTIGITDFSRRVTDEFGVTTVVERSFSRRLSVRLAVPASGVDTLHRRLTDLRSTSALWIADSASEWLSVQGFYKDFSIDAALVPVSFCTLTIEGLAQTEIVPDTGVDPAPPGMLSSLQLLQPVTVIDGILASSSAPETEYAEWSAGTSYPQAARVLKAATHRIYESANGGNLNHDPAALTGEWIDIGPTNRWAMFDQALGTATTTPSPLVVTLNATAANAIALIDVVAATVRVQATGYDKTRTATNGTVTFLDMPSTTGVVTITVTGSGSVSVGTLLVGKVVKLGVTETSPTAGITDYSRKVQDEFGDVQVVQRAWAKRMTANALIRTSAIDQVANRIAAVRARPSLWIGGAGLDLLTIYGFFKDFSIERGQGVSKLSLSVEGLSKAAPLPVAVIVPVPVLRGLYDAASSYAAGNLVSYEGSTWEYIAPAASVGNAPPTLPIEENDFWRVFARAGANGADGNGTPGQSNFLHIAYSNAADGSVAFTTEAPGSRTYLGVLVDGNVSDSTNPAAYAWSLIKGADGLNGANGTPGAPGANGLTTYVHIAYSNSANGSANFSVDDPVGRAYVGFYVDQTQADSTNPALYAWSLVKGTDGRDGLNGTNGAPGAPGANGQATYLHTAYADSADGVTNFTTGLPGARTYLGILVDQTVADSTNPAAYAWSLIKGADGLDGSNGSPGAPGANGQSTYVHIAYSNSANGTLNFSVDDPAGRSYVGFYVDQTVTDSTNPALYAWSLVKGADGRDGLNGTNGAPGAPGANGQSSYLHTAYANSADGSVNFTTGDPGTRTYLGVLIDQNVADSNNPALYAWSLIKGADGLNGSNGTPGAPGANGQPTYVHIAYSNAADGSVNFSVDDPSGRTYVGFYVDQAIGDSTNPAAYAWSLVKGTDGAAGVSPSVVSLNKASLTFAADSSGVVKAGQQPQFVLATFKTGTEDHTSAASWSIPSASTSASVSVDATGKVTITNVTGAGEATVRGAFGGVTPQDQTFNWTRPTDAPPPAGATSLSAAPAGVVYATQTTFPATPTRTLTIDSNGSGQIGVELALSYFAGATSAGANAAFSFNVAAYVGYRIAGSGSAFTGFSGGAVTGSASTSPGQNIEPASEGTLTLSQTQASLSANTSYEVGFFLRRTAALRSDVASFGSSYTVRQP